MKSLKAAMLISSIILISGCTGGLSPRSVMSKITSPATDEPIVDPDQQTPGLSGPNSEPSPSEQAPTQVVTNNPPPVVIEVQKNISDPHIAEVKVQEAQAALQADPQYAFVADDLSLLEEEGLIDSNSDLKGWVK